MNRAPGLSVRAKLTLSYAGFLMVAGALMLAAAWVAGQPGQLRRFLVFVPQEKTDWSYGISVSLKNIGTVGLH